MKNVTLFLLILFSSNCFSQNWTQKMQEPGANFYEIKKDFEEYWKNRDTKIKGSGYKAFKRWEYMVEKRVFPSGELSQLNQTAENFQKFLKEQTSSQINAHVTNNSSQIASSTWTALGPFGPMSGSAGPQLLKSGRINFITLNPFNSNDMWIGAPAGGLWHSTNAGTTWTTNTDNLPVNGCSDLAIDPTNTLVMYLAMGDGDAGDTRSVGVYKTNNGGTTWNTTGLTNAVTNYFLIRRLLIYPTNTQIILAATNAGIYRSTNAGVSWTQITTASVYDLEFKPSHPNVIYAAGTSFSISTNSGASFSQVSNGIPTTGVNRMAIAVTPADTNYVYVLASSSTASSLQGVYKSTVGGTLFTTSPSPATLNLLGYSNTGADNSGQGWYDLCIAASPLNRDEVVTGGVNIWRSTDGVNTFSIYGHWTGSSAPFIHADQHCLVYDATGNLYATNDGTAYKRTGSTWTEISGTINISEIYRIGMSSLSANRWITGHQDNGSGIWNGSIYNACLGGDGMGCFIDRTTNNNAFAEYYYGSLQKSTNGGSSWATITPTAAGSGGWVTPWKQDPVNSSLLYAGYSEMWSSNNLGTTWSQLSAIGGGTNVTITEFVISPSSTQVIFVIKGSSIYRTTNGGVSWTNVTGTLPLGSASAQYLCISPTNSNNVWVALSGYSSGNKVFMTNNGGTSWINYSSNLPNIPANCVLYQPGSNDMIYVGMDVGVYYRDNLSTTWTLYNTGLPNVPISELQISAATPGLLHAATYGRGVWAVSTIVPGTPPVSSFSVSSSNKCTGTAITFSDISSNYPNAWSWTVVPSSGVNINTSSSQNPQITFANSGIYTISIVASNSVGAGNVFTQTISVGTLPTVNISNSSNSVCISAPVSFTANGASNYTWSNNGGNLPVATFSPTSFSIYTVTGGINGCTASQTVSILPLANPTISVSGNSVVCFGDAVTLFANGANTYTWSFGQQGAVVSATPVSSSIFTAIGSYPNGCKSSVLFSITVNNLPTINLSASDTIICKDGFQSTTLTANGALNYTWSPGGNTGSLVVLIPTTTTTFTCLAEDSNGCVNSNMIYISVSLCEGIKDLKVGRLKFSIYPNPTKGKLFISVNTKDGKDVTAEIRDINRKLLFKQNLNFDNTFTELINLPNLSTGIYFVRFTNGILESESVRILKE